MNKEFITSRKRITTIWIIGVSITFLLLILQTIGGIYTPQTFKAWLWFLINFLPISISLIYSYSDKFDAVSGKKPLLISIVLILIVFLIIILSTIFLQTYMQKARNLLPVNLLMNSLYFLIPIQFCIVSLFFLQVKISKQELIKLINVNDSSALLNNKKLGNSEIIHSLKELLTKNIDKTFEELNKLSAIPSVDNNFKNTVVHLTSRYNALNQEINMNTINHNDASVEMAKIAKALLSVIDSIPDLPEFFE
jgi:hypothetical protein